MTMMNDKNTRRGGNRNHRRRPLLLCGVLSLLTPSIVSTGSQNTQASSSRELPADRHDHTHTLQHASGNRASGHRRETTLSYQWIFGYAMPEALEKSDGPISISSPHTSSEESTSLTRKSKHDFESQYGFIDDEPGCHTQNSNFVPTTMPASYPTYRPGRPTRNTEDHHSPTVSNRSEDSFPAASSFPSSVPASSTNAPSRPLEHVEPYLHIPEYSVSQTSSKSRKRSHSHSKSAKLSSSSKFSRASHAVPGKGGRGGKGGKKGGKKSKGHVPVAPTTSEPPTSGWAPTTPETPTTPTGDKFPPIGTDSPSSSPQPTRDCYDEKHCGRPPRPI